MVCLEFEPGQTVWKAQTNPLSYGGIPDIVIVLVFVSFELFICSIPRQ